MVENFTNSILLSDYMEAVAPTDRLKFDDIKTVLLGLFGEVGSLMSAVKKHRRDATAYIGYKNAVVEELGDAVWYLAAVCRRLNFTFDEIFTNAINTGKYELAMAANDLSNAPISTVSIADNFDDKDEALTKLAVSTTSLFEIGSNPEDDKILVVNFAENLLLLVNATKIPFSTVLRKNIEKAKGTFLPPDIEAAVNFDKEFEEYERLPDEFEIKITQRADGKSYMSMNGVFIGDPLTDNILDEDGYRFHDVFHFAFAAILHWSPTFRALLKRKRKSNRAVDEAQDGGRAIVVEEGLSAWIFATAKNLSFFEGHDRISVDILKIVHQFVSGYEVESCSLSLWNKAILEGYKVFRQVKANNGGVVIASRLTRSIEYRPHEIIT